MLRFRKSVVISPSTAAAAAVADSTRQYVHPILGGTDIGVIPSATVIMPSTHSPDAPYPFRKVAEDVVNMTRGFDTIYVYTDVVESRIVGDSLAPLVRALPVGGIHGATVSDRFTNIHYVPLLYSHFKSIEMDIRDDTGRRVPFEYGKVTVTLNFRRRRTGLRRCPIPTRYRTTQSVRKSAAQRHATHQERCRGVGKGGIEDRRAHSRRRHVRTEYKKVTKRRVTDAGRNLMRGLLAPGLRARKRIKRVPAKKESL